jgi:hypothetical protein
LARAAGAVSNLGDLLEREVPRDASLEGVRTLRSWTGTEKTSRKDSGVQSPSHRDGGIVVSTRVLSEREMLYSYTSMFLQILRSNV